MLDANNDIWIVDLEKEPVWNRIRNCTDIVGMEPTEPNHEGDAERMENDQEKEQKKKDFESDQDKKERKRNFFFK